MAERHRGQRVRRDRAPFRSVKEGQRVRVLEKLSRQRTARSVSEEGAETEDASRTG